MKNLITNTHQKYIIYITFTILIISGIVPLVTGSSFEQLSKEEKSNYLDEKLCYNKTDLTWALSWNNKNKSFYGNCEFSSKAANYTFLTELYPILKSDEGFNLTLPFLGSYYLIIIPFLWAYFSNNKKIERFKKYYFWGPFILLVLISIFPFLILYKINLYFLSPLISLTVSILVIKHIIKRWKELKMNKFLLYVGLFGTACLIITGIIFSYLAIMMTIVSPHSNNISVSVINLNIGSYLLLFSVSLVLFCKVKNLSISKNLGVKN